MEILEKMKFILNELESDSKKFFLKNNKSAGIRIRSKMQDFKKLAQDVRVEISRINNEK